ncbi:MAG: hypothetical protein CBR30_03830 [Dictyoglomus sp. NZ13-RE01]|nr:MAG: hypothetical protein CBR30_03830 [Dictyoglomus sp. NZ13-RE01]
MITTKDLASKLINYMYNKISIEELVNWAEKAFMEEEFEEEHFDTIRDILAYIGLSDIIDFHLTWEDCKKFLEKLEYCGNI